MKERPLREAGRITDKLPEAVAPLSPDTRTMPSLRRPTGRASPALRCPEVEERPLPYGFTAERSFAGRRRGVLYASLCLFGVRHGNPFWQR